MTASGDYRRVRVQLKSLTYTSLASFDLTSQDLMEIQQTAEALNALEGTTGLLVFNGTHFLQVVEGTPEAIDDLLERLYRDRRHHGIEVRDLRLVDERCFPDWSMELVRVESRFVEARETLNSVLPSGLPTAVSARVLQMTESISGTVELPD